MSLQPEKYLVFFWLQNMAIRCSLSVPPARDNLWRQRFRKKENLLISQPFMFFMSQGSCPWCLWRSSPTSATPPCCTHQRWTPQTSGKPGSALPGPGSTLSSGPCPLCSDGAATGRKVRVPHVRSSGTIAPQPASPTCCVSSSSACCCHFCWWSTPMGASWLQSGGWVQSQCDF